MQMVKDLVPHKLAMFLELLANSNSANKCLSIAQDIMTLVTRRITPKHLTTASTIKQITGSKLLINQLNKLGHCASYTELQRFETAAALTKL